MKFTVGELIQLLGKLPPEARVFTVGLEGVHDLELGNLCPFKVMKTPFSTALFVDDGVGVHPEMADWVPLDEFAFEVMREIQK